MLVYEKFSVSGLFYVFLASKESLCSGCIYLHYSWCPVLRVCSHRKTPVLQLSVVYNSVVYSTDRSKTVAPVLVLLFVAFRFILQGDLFLVLPCVIL